MSAYIKNLIDYNGDIVYPQTRTDAIFNKDGNLLSDVLADVDNTVVFNTDGSIAENYIDGTSKTTVFNDDGSITTTSYKSGIAQKVETTVFNADGSISTTYTKGSGN